MGDVACLHPGVVSTDLWRQGLSKENYDRVQDMTKIVEDSLPDFLKDGLNILAAKAGDLGVFKTVEQGATTSVWLAAGEYQSDYDDVRTDAQYYDNCETKPLDDFATDSIAAERLWEESEERAGISFDIKDTRSTEGNDGTIDDSTNDLTNDSPDDDVIDNSTDDEAEKK